jgi:hypothetical protein
MGLGRNSPLVRSLKRAIGSIKSCGAPLREMVNGRRQESNENNGFSSLSDSHHVCEMPPPNRPDMTRMQK